MKISLIRWLLLIFSTAACGFAQTSASTMIDGTVYDPSHAVIVGATINLHNDNADFDTVTDGTGHYKVILPPTTYNLTVKAQGFRPYSRMPLVISTGATVVNINLDIATEEQQVDVSPDSALSTDASANASAMVFKAADLDTLSDDPNTLQQQLLALSGNDPTNASQIYVDGFSNGTLPPKESIREIHINQNPFTAQFDKFGLGRIEIFTKPGGDKLHGSIDANLGTSALDARNPYAGVRPPYIFDFFDASLNGPVGKGTSFYLTARRIDSPANAIINASTLDANLNPLNISQSVSNPNVSQTYSVRGDRQFGKSDTGIARYIFSDISQPNLGIGSLILPSQASSSDVRTQTLQLTDTHVFNAKIVMDAAFQYIRIRQQQNGVSPATSIVVQGAFSAGGSPSQTLHDSQDLFEIRDYLSLAERNHFIRTGFRYRFLRDANLNTANYNGQFIFSSLTAFQITQQGLRQHLTDQQIRATCIPGTNGTPTCGGASQFSLTTGNPRATISTGDLGVYAEDEWKGRPSLSLNYGFRIESQSAVPDHFDLAPRVGFAYSVKTHKAKSPMLVVRGGFGLFFTRFDSTYLLQARRQNGINQLANLVTNPVYACTATTPLPCLTPDLSQAAGSATSPTIYRISPRLRSPVQMQGLLTVEHSFGKYGQASVNYYHLRTTHLYGSLNVNAPLPSTGLRPLGGTQNIYQYSSEGVAKWYLFTANVTLNLSKHVSLYSFASDGHREQTAFGPDQFPSNSYDISADLGTPSTYGAQQFFVGVNTHPGWDTVLSLFVGILGPKYFDITTGQDNNGDSIYNDRPAFATDLTRKSVVHTSYGNFDTAPLPSQTIIPFNYGRTPSVVYTELSANKNFHLGRLPAMPSRPGVATTGKEPAPQRPFQLQFGVEVDNVLNHINPGPPVGVVTSPLFGRSLSLNSSFSLNSASNRALMFHAKFSF